MLRLADMASKIEPLEPEAGSQPEMDAASAVAEASRLIGSAQQASAQRVRLARLPKEEPQPEPRLLTFPEWLAELAMRPETPWYERMALLGALLPS